MPPADAEKYNTVLVTCGTPAALPTVFVAFFGRAENACGTAWHPYVPV